MSDTIFVAMYHPALGNVQVQAPLLAVPTYQSHGWLLVDPNATPPPVATPYLTQAAGDSRYLRAWLGGETLTAGAVRMTADGHIIVRTADGATRSSYDATEAALWTVVSGGSGGTVSDAAVAAQVTAGTATQAALKAALVPKWQPSTAYTSGDYVLNPSGQIASANATHTSGASYTAGNWTVVSGGGTVSDASTSAKGIVQLAGDLAGSAAAPTVAKINGAAPATVATSGAYADLSGKPTIPTPTSLVADSTILTNLTPQRQRTSRIAFFGDSITGYLYKYPVLAQALSLGRIQVTGLYSHAGLASAALVPFVTDFTNATPKPGKVVILCGTNDAQGTVTAGAFRTNLLAIAQAALNAGIEPVLCTIPPLGSQFTEAKRGNVAAINAQVKILAASLNLQVIDFHPLLTDPANGQYLATYDSGDGIHPAYPAQLAMAQATASTLQPSTPPGGLPLVDFNTDASNLFTNPLALTDANTDGIPDGWDAFNSATGLAYSTATDAAIKGKWATITATASSAASQIQNRRVGGFSAGDTCYFACLVKTSGLNSAGGFALYVNWWQDYGGTVIRADNIGSGGSVGSGPGLYAATLVAPAGATQVSIQLQPSASTGVYQIGQVTGYNETALAIS